MVDEKKLFLKALQEKFDEYACAFIRPSSQEQRPAVKKEGKNTSNAR